MSPRDELIARLTRAHAEAGRARTAVVQAQEDAARAADTFEQIFATYHTDWVAQARAAAGEAARLVAAIDRAASDLRSHLDHLTDGSG